MPAADIVSYSGRTKYTAYFTVDGTTTPASITDGADLGTITDNGVGDWTITYTVPFQKISSVKITPIQTGSIKAEAQIRAAGSTTSSVRILAYDLANSNAAVDCLLYVEVTGEIDPY